MERENEQLGGKLLKQNLVILDRNKRELLKQSLKFNI